MAQKECFDDFQFLQQKPQQKIDKYFDQHWLKNDYLEIMMKTMSEDARRVSQRNPISDGLFQFGLQLGYSINKWNSSSKTLDLKVGQEAFILGNDLTPQTVFRKNISQPSRAQQSDQNKSDLFISSNSSEVKVEIKNRQDEDCSKDIFQGSESFECENIKDEQETENQRKLKSKQYLQIYQNTILFTYRKNFLPLLSKLDCSEEVKNQTSDSGWGCMIRAGQMIFAQGIKRHLKRTDYIEDLQMLNIILGFLEDEEGQEHPYSIHQVSNKAFKSYKINPGTWYTPNQISIILKEIHQKNRIKGTEDLKVAVHGSDKPIIFEKILQTLTGKKNIFNCSHENAMLRSSINQDQLDESLDVEVIGPFNQQENDKGEESKQKIIDNLCCKECNKTSNKLLLLIPCRLGLEVISSIHLKILKKLLSLKYSIGMIGGKPNKAHYFLGYIEDDLLYLDPHWIGDSIPQEVLMKNLSTFFSSEVYKMPFNKLSTSLVFGFYFNSIDELNEFYQILRQLEREYKEDFFLVIEKQTPSYVTCNQSEVKKLEQQFQLERNQKNLADFDKNQFENYDGSLYDDLDENDDTDFEEKEISNYNNYNQNKNGNNFYEQYRKQDDSDKTQLNNLNNNNFNSINNNYSNNIKNNEVNSTMQDSQPKYQKIIETIKNFSLQKHQSEEELQNLQKLYFQSKCQQQQNQNNPPNQENLNDS